MLGQNLRQLWESLGPKQCSALISENLESGEFKPEDFSLRELAESFCGHDWVRRLNPRNVDSFGAVPVLEAGEGVDVAAFSNSTGQIFYNRIMEGWKNAAFIGDQLCSTVQTDLDGEKMPWLGHVGSEGEGLQPGQPYPEASFGERYIETPATTKQGMIVSVTKEMIFFDRTGQALRAAGEVGYKLGYRREKAILDGVLGVTNPYKLNGTSYNTYLSTDPATLPQWCNQKSGLPLLDYTALDAAFQLSQKVLDPDTGNPLADAGLFTDLLVMPARYITARRITRATEVRQAVPGFATSGNPTNTLASNEATLPWTLQPLTSPILYQRAVAADGLGKTATQANEYWMTGQFKKAFAWMQNWALTTVQAPANNIKEFEQDIVVRHKASYRGAFAVLEPRYAFQFYST